jgi:hypothetical protein
MGAKATTFIAPDWHILFGRHESGLQVMGFDPSTGFGFSLQPLYSNDTDLPIMVIIGNYFPSRQFPPPTEELKRDMEAAAQKSLGATYRVTLKLGR